jgi:hypothetical protein
VVSEVDKLCLCCVKMFDKIELQLETVTFPVWADKQLEIKASD